MLRERGRGVLRGAGPTALPSIQVRAEEAGAGTQPGPERAETLAAKIQNSKLARICVVCNSESMEPPTTLRSWTRNVREPGSRKILCTVGP